MYRRVPRSIGNLCDTILPLLARAASGRRMMDYTAKLVDTDRWNSFDRFHDTTVTLVEAYEAAGAEADVYQAQTGGMTGTGRWIIPEAEDFVEATVDVTRPVKRRLLDYKKCPWHLTQWSSSTPARGVTCELLILDTPEEMDKAPLIGVIDLDDGVYSDVVMITLDDNADIVYNGTDVEEGKRVVRESGASALLVIEGNFSSNIGSNVSGDIEIYWYMSGTGIFDSISSAGVSSVLAQASSNITSYMILTSSELDPAIVTTPFVTEDSTILKSKEMDGISPAVISAVLQQQNMFMPILIMLIIVMIGGIVISSMGMEKENKTLETLLTMPINRTSIVAGKLIGAAVVGLVFGGIYMVGLSYYLQGLSVGTTIDLSKYGLELGLADYAILALMMFLSILSALALCMIFGAFAKNYKAAQSLTLPVTLLAMIPMFVTMFTDFNSLPELAQAALFVIPFTHPMMAMNNLMFGDYVLVGAGLAYNAAFALVAIYIAVRIFKSDILLTGFRTKGKDLRRMLSKYRGH